MSGPEIVVHVLSVREAGEEAYRVRGTVRSGKLIDGLALWFADESGKRCTVVLRDLEVEEGKLKGVLEGESGAALRAGAYLYSPPAGEP